MILTNLFLLLIAFGLLSRHFERTRIPAKVMEAVWNKFDGQIGKRI